MREKIEKEPERFQFTSKEEVCNRYKEQQHALDVVEPMVTSCFMKSLNEQFEKLSRSLDENVAACRASGLS